MKMLAFLASFVLAAGMITATDISPVLFYLNDRANTQFISVIGHTVNSNHFLKTIKNGVSGSSADVIVVDNLRDEDIRFLFEQKTELKENTLYEPSVESPYHTLIQYLDENQIKVNEHQTNDVNEALNLFLQKKENNQAKSVFLVGRENKQINLRKKRDTLASNQNITIFGVNCAAFLSSLSITDNSVSGQSISFNLTVDTSGAGPTIACNDISDNGTVTLSVSFTNNTGLHGSSINNIQMKFTNNKYYWQLSSANISTSKEMYSLIYMGSPYSMETPITFSFACTRTVFQLQNSTATTLPFIKVNLYIMDFQLQPYNMSVNSTSNVYTFGKANYCQGFFTSGIWMAITASLILTLILAFGVSFLFGINTMDRFDDPKGKPLSIALEK